MIRAFVENPRIISLSIALLIVWGLAALATLPRTEDPLIVGRLGVVITQFPGASAERVEALVTEKLENRLRELPELQHIFSSSRRGLSLINLEVKEQYSEEQVDLVWSKARDLMNEARSEFPDGAGAPTLDSHRNHAFTQLLAVEASDPDTSIAVLNRHAAQLESLLRSVPGTELVRRFGAPVEEIHVTADNRQLSHAGLTIGQLAAALQRADSKTTAGLLSGPQSVFSVDGERAYLSRYQAAHQRPV